jgi:hypothetical protein
MSTLAQDFAFPDDFLEPPPQPPAAKDSGEGEGSRSSTNDAYVFNGKLQVS